MRIISVREQPEYKDKAIRFFQESWPMVYPVIYEDSIHHSINAENDLPQWYLLETGNRIIGGAGLITNDFISRMDLYPWICAVFIAEDQRGNNYGKLLINMAKKDSKRFGFNYLYLSTEHIGYYEKFGFEYIGQGYHPWEEASRIYQIKL
jgi:N-acetylglutamate synthase-like GNAT family acetyltransferase